MRAFTACLDIKHSPVIGRLNLLKCKEECCCNDDDNGHEYQDSNLIGRHEQAVAVEPVTAGETLPLALRHDQTVFHHLTMSHNTPDTQGAPSTVVT